VVVVVVRKGEQSSEQQAMGVYQQLTYQNHEE
jgi:hypothetical protein